MKSLLILCLTSGLASAHAHDGHGRSGTHWHGSDAFGFALLGVAVALVVWAARSK